MLNETYKIALEKQLQLLFERSKDESDNKVVGELTEKMISLVKILDPDLRNQSAFEKLNPYVGHLSMSDLEMLAQARAEHARQRLEAERQWCKDHKVQFVQT